MDLPLAARAGALIGPTTRVVFGALLALVLVACRRDAKKPLRILPLEGESASLPRVLRPHADPALTTKSVRTIDAGSRRSYVLIEPRTREPGRRYPLVLVFHGDGGDAAGFHDAWSFERTTGDGAFLAYPEGRSRTWDLETTSNNPDIRFIDALVAELVRTAPIDPSHVFGTGYSSGGFMVNVLACHRPALFRAIASNAGGAPYNQREKWTNGYPKCPGQGPTAMLALHGEHDFGVSLDSGRFSAEYWAYVNGCTTDEMEPTGYPECRAYRGCPKGKAVGFCSIPPLGHWVWDQAADASWTFFERQ